MKDAYEVLYQKEADLVRVRQEVESLRMAVSLLTPDGSAEDPVENPGKRSPAPASDDHLETTATGTDGPAPISRGAGFWKALRNRRR